MANETWALQLDEFPFPFYYCENFYKQDTKMGEKNQTFNINSTALLSSFFPLTVSFLEINTIKKKKKKKVFSAGGRPLSIWTMVHRRLQRDSKVHRDEVVLHISVYVWMKPFSKQTPSWVLSFLPLHPFVFVVVNAMKPTNFFAIPRTRLEAPAKLHPHRSY